MKLMGILSRNALLCHSWEEWNHCDAFEVRLDTFYFNNKWELQELRRELNKPILFSFRRKEEGGYFSGSEEERVSLYVSYLSLIQPDYIDIEWDVTPFAFEKIAKAAPKAKIIISYHNFQETPNDLSQILSQMTHVDAYAYKMVTYTDNPIDALRLMVFLKKTKTPLSAFTLGSSGYYTRALAPIMGSEWTYVPLDNHLKLNGMLDLNMLLNVYHIKSKGITTHCYALLGDPVSKSLGHIYHNEAFVKNKRDAVYVKIPVAGSDLAMTLQLLQQLDFRGASVTMPLKKLILSYCHQLSNSAARIQAVNTLCFKDNEIYGENTDGKGAIEAIKQYSTLFPANALVVGAGGAASAIVNELLKQGVCVFIYNRSLDKAQELVSRYEVSIYSEHSFDQVFDCLIKATPVFEKKLIGRIKLSKDACVMDITYTETDPNWLVYLKDLEKSVVTVPGYAMFESQAAAQQQLWGKNCIVEPQS